MVYIAKIPGYDEYLATKCGKVLSLRFKKVKELRSSKSRKGYLQVSLWKDGAQKTFGVHKLVLDAFIRRREIGEVCRHLNGDPADNRLENLRWGTPEENSRDMVLHGNYPKSRFSPEQFEAMRSDPGSNAEVARKWGVHPSYISHIRAGRRG